MKPSPKDVEMEDQRRIWDREYGERGTMWCKRTLHMPSVFRGRVVLEAGVGNGKTLAAILEQDPRYVVAYDHSIQALRKCVRDTRVGLVLADAAYLPFRDSCFEAASYYFILDGMLRKRREASAAEAARVLKPGALLLFEDFASGDFRQSAPNVEAGLEPGTVLKRKGLICHYFDEDEVKVLFQGFSAGDVSVVEYRPFAGCHGLRRRVVRATFTRST